MAYAHPFNFAGGAELSHMGATWFVSYAYYQHIDANHKIWTKVKTALSRSSIYHKTVYYHVFWLNQVLLMDNARLNTNSLNLNAYQTKLMAKAVLEKIDKPV